MPKDNQLDLDFRAPAEDGYASWQWDRREAVEQIVKLWGLPVGRQVRLRRTGIDGDFEGRLELASMPVRMDRRLPLELRMGKMKFSSGEVETCSVIGPAEGE